MGLKMTAVPVNFENVPKDAQWYTIVTKFNYEQKFTKDLLASIKNLGLENQILEVVLPNKEHYIKTTDDKGKVKTKVTIEKLMPLYVFVKAIMNEKVFYHIRNTAGCANIMAAGGSLLVMTESEINNVKQQCGLLEKENQLIKEQKLKAIKEIIDTFSGKIGDSVKINDDKFINYTGVIKNINYNKGKANVILNNGMPIEVDIAILQIYNE